MARESQAEGFLAGRSTLAAAVILIALALLLPLWSTRMEAPQYQDDEILEIQVSAGRVSGDVAEINLLNQYVGVHLPLDTPELKASPWVLSTVLMLGVLAFFQPATSRRRGALILCLVMAGVLVGGAGLLQYRLYQMGHDRTESIMARVPDFTPPVLGSKKIANFQVSMRLGPGGWAYLSAMWLAAWTAWRLRPRGSARSSKLSAEPQPAGERQYFEREKTSHARSLAEVRR